jgi:hypothetical protein
MIAAQTDRVLLIDDPSGPARTTANLVASLAARYRVLHGISGADAIGSLTAGFAALGREVSRTAPGAQLRKALEASRAGANGSALWKALHIGAWASTLPASPVLNQLRNDVALLLADDLDTTIDLLQTPIHLARADESHHPEPALFVDCLIGLWAFSGELVRCIEALAAPTLARSGGVESTANPNRELDGSLLR